MPATRRADRGLGGRDLGTEAANIKVAHVIGENEDDVGLGIAAREATAPDKCEETLAAAAERQPS